MVHGHPLETGSPYKAAAGSPRGHPPVLRVPMGHMGTQSWDREWSLRFPWDGLLLTPTPSQPGEEMGASGEVPLPGAPSASPTVSGELCTSSVQERGAIPRVSPALRNTRRIDARGPRQRGLGPVLGSALAKLMAISLDGPSSSSLRPAWGCPLPSDPPHVLLKGGQPLTPVLVPKGTLGRLRERQAPVSRMDMSVQKHLVKR